MLHRSTTFPCARRTFLLFFSALDICLAPLWSILTLSLYMPSHTALSCYLCLHGAGGDRVSIRPHTSVP